MSLILKAVENIPLIEKGDDIAEIIFKNAPDIADKDIIVIASTIISKSLGLTFREDEIVPSAEAERIAALNGKDPRFVQAILDQSLEVFTETPFMLVRNTNGHVCINAGIDASNVGGDLLLTLPEKPDGHAAAIGKAIEQKSGKKISVIITDTNGRSFKEGQTNVAVGLYNIKPIRQWIGEKDLYGKVLEISEEAVVDEIAGAANLIMGEGGDGVPAVIVRGLDLYTDEAVSVTEMYRSKERDLIIQGLLELKNKK
ncbi:Bifunctional F420 biosynthesis protein FbiB [Methanimicrococcus stummii]|uniref:Bifunctional F420 biosynthesis protein FbiB n=1 Tax=Methanimicrococcus stummii TaxID=3028294 RepID=A0AA96ZXP9_9EURY|nr:coenzyme F420-0:L-glutamate ligase [Methanimicrococcus sp. Es2]WNY29224.1 Bifunctional F420 biosynthesis protein FbiB [Methanimicrococcus sp. Es2]